MKKIIYVDMDGVLADFGEVLTRIDEKEIKKYKKGLSCIPGIFKNLKPIPDAIESVKKLNEFFDVYVLSTAPWLNTPARTHKIERIHKYFGSDENSILYKKLILSHNKNLNVGDYLIDDRDANGAKDFKGEWIHFGTKKFPNWESILNYIGKKENIKF